MDISEMPTQIIGSPGLSNQENSNPNLDINLQIPLTGLMGSEQSCKSSQKPLVVSGFFSGRSKNL